jgi:hypothetical protein
LPASIPIVRGTYLRGFWLSLIFILVVAYGGEPYLPHP